MEVVLSFLLKASVPDGEEGIETVSLSLISLQQLRDKFPVWKDADAFRL